MLYEQGLNDREISEQTDAHKCTIAKWRHKNNLPPLSHHRINGDEETTIRQLHSEKMSDTRIAKVINRQVCTVSHWRRAHGLEAHHECWFHPKPIENTDEEEPPWQDPESLYCDGEFLEKLMNRPIKRYKLEPTI